MRLQIPAGCLATLDLTVQGDFSLLQSEKLLSAFNKCVFVGCYLLLNFLLIAGVISVPGLSSLFCLLELLC